MVVSVYLSSAFLSFDIMFIDVFFKLINFLAVFLWSKYRVIRNTQTTKPNPQLNRYLKEQQKQKTHNTTQLTSHVSPHGAETHFTSLPTCWGKWHVLHYHGVPKPSDFLRLDESYPRFESPPCPQDKGDEPWYGAKKKRLSIITVL